ncbi:MAG: 26S proteasome regulatory subunit [Trizodia sp. TS-e1964]|nr:MAG: 26S proteasome regulatory subunit [Trizodia sp. TS-e1964]
MDPKAIPKFLAAQRDAAPDDFQAVFLELEDYWKRSLWHQLTDSLLQYYSNPQSRPQRIAIYQQFILTFAEKINQLKLVTLGLTASAEYEDGHERLAFLKALTAKVNKPASQDAFVYATVAVASVKLQLQDVEGARKELDEAERILDRFDSVETVVHASFYRINADYYDHKLEFASYYRNALLFLACIDLSDLTPQESQSRAYDLSVAALASDSIYNFGELLLHPILDSLKNTQHAWLRELLFAFNRGDLVAFNGLAGNISKNKLLEQHEKFLRQKICLSALTETIFRRPPHDRTMTFTTISEETKVGPKEIEHLIMKALSLGLIRGTIDQVDKLAKISWVQPKVLDMQQIANMRLRLKEWDSTVNKLGNWIEGVGQDVWAA